MGGRWVSPEEGRGGPDSVHCAALLCSGSHVFIRSWRFRSSDELGGSGSPSRRFGLMGVQSALCGYPGSTSTGSVSPLSVLSFRSLSPSQHHGPDNTRTAWSFGP